MDLKKIIEKIKGKINGQSKKKLIENGIVIIILGVIILVTASSIFKPKGKNASEINDIPLQNTAVSQVKNYESELEERMEAILSGIEGAGRVEVMITFETGKEVIPAKNSNKSKSETIERDSEGGSRTVTQIEADENIAYESNGSEQKPVIIKEIQPKVLGVVVVSDGGESPTIKEKITRAVQALVDVPLHKIQVFKHKK
ncbi:MAG: stage III sporulation protein AG [Eubacteriales bacterium]|nr:stage III sporulation protein AG [Eubacteriales bacterium]